MYIRASLSFKLEREEAAFFGFSRSIFRIVNGMGAGRV